MSRVIEEGENEEISEGDETKSVSSVDSDENDEIQEQQYQASNNNIFLGDCVQLRKQVRKPVLHTDQSALRNHIMKEYEEKLKSNTGLKVNKNTVTLTDTEN